jgi:hypothetical protein
MRQKFFSRHAATGSCDITTSSTPGWYADQKLSSFFLQYDLRPSYPRHLIVQHTLHHTHHGPHSPYYHLPCGSQTDADLGHSQRFKPLSSYSLWTLMFVGFSILNSLFLLPESERRNQKLEKQETPKNT